MLPESLSQAIEKYKKIPFDQVEELINENTQKPNPISWAWSVSRSNTLNSCARHYYLHYLASRKISGQNSMVNLLSQLKQLKGAYSELGSVIHEVAATYITRHKRGESFNNWSVVEDIKQKWQERLQEGDTGVFAWAWDVYGGYKDPRDDFFSKKLAHTAGVLVSSHRWDRITKLEPEHIIEIDPPFNKIKMDGILPVTLQVYAIPDLLVKKNGYWHLVDWKSGKVRGKPEIPMQAAIYKLYVMEKHGAKEAEVVIRIVGLGEDNGIDVPVQEISVSEGRQYLHDTAYQMWDSMDDPENGISSIENFPKLKERYTMHPKYYGSKTDNCFFCPFKMVCWE